MSSSAIISALRRCGGRATLGDLMSRTRLPAAELEQAILPALCEARGHVAVDHKGELVYYLPRDRPARSAHRLRSALALLYELFQVAFFATLSLVFVGYAVVYAVILAGLALGAADGCGCDACGCDCCACDCCDCDCDRRGRVSSGREREEGGA